MRTRARSTLRLFLGGATPTVHRIRSAIQVLGHHHSGSTLPGQVLARLQDTADQSEAGAGEMSQSGPWQCRCGRANKMSSDYCGQCGTGWWQLSADSQSAPASGGNPQHGQHARGPPAQNPAPWSYQAGQSAPGSSSVACAAEGGRQIQGAFCSCYAHARESRCRSPVAGRDSVALLGQCAGGLASACGCAGGHGCQGHYESSALVHPLGGCMSEAAGGDSQCQGPVPAGLGGFPQTLRQQASEFQKKMVDLQSQEEQVQEKLEKAKLQLSQLSAGLEAKPEEAAEMAVSEPVRDVADMATVTALQQGIEELCSRHLVDTEQQAELPDPWVAPATPRPKAVKKPKAENGDGSDALSISSSPVPGKAGP